MREMKRIWDADQWKTIASKRTGSSNCASIGPTPQILRTCKAIHREATPILYSGNVFQFYLRRGDAKSHPGYKGWNETPTDALNSIIFAIFLRQIGQQNAASLKRLKFFVPEVYARTHTQLAGCAIQVFTQLLKCHVPGVRQVKICRGLVDQDQYEKEPAKLVDDGLEGFGENDSDHTTKSQAQMFAPKQTEMVSNDADFDDQGTDGHYHPPSAVRREEQEAMYKATADMVQEITWLDQLSFAGFDQDVPAFEKMKQLEALVKVRR